MIVIALLGTIGGFFAVRTFGHLRERAYATEKQVVESRLALAGRIETLCDTTIQPKQVGDRLTFETTSRVPPPLATVLKRPIPLRYDHELEGVPRVIETNRPYPNEAPLPPS